MFFAIFPFLSFFSFEIWSINGDSYKFGTLKKSLVITATKTAIVTGINTWLVFVISQISIIKARGACVTDAHKAAAPAIAREELMFVNWVPKIKPNAIPIEKIGPKWPPAHPEFIQITVIKALPNT